MSGNVIKSFAGKGTSQYDDKNSYIEVTMPITAEGSDAVLGVILVSVSTDTIVATMDVLEGKANIVEVILVRCV